MTASTKPSKPFLIGVAGGSGSGKTFFAQALSKRLGPAHCEIVYQDNFYIDQSSRFDFDGGSVNFDHPDSIDFPLLASSLAQLRQGLETEIPIYDFVMHKRRAETLTIHPKAVIIVDGILVLHAQPVRELFHDGFFFRNTRSLALPATPRPRRPRARPHSRRRSQPIRKTSEAYARHVR